MEDMLVRLFFGDHVVIVVGESKPVLPVLRAAYAVLKRGSAGFKRQM